MKTFDKSSRDWITYPMIFVDQFLDEANRMIANGEKDSSS